MAGSYMGNQSTSTGHSGAWRKGGDCDPGFAVTTGSGYSRGCKGSGEGPWAARQGTAPDFYPSSSASASAKPFSASPIIPGDGKSEATRAKNVSWF